jgi:hypothetical protein
MKQITILRAPGQYLTKRYWRATDGTIGKEGAPRVAEFVVEFIDYEDAEGLFAAFEGLAHHADRCVIRAVPGRHAPQDTTAKV